MVKRIIPEHHYPQTSPSLIFSVRILPEEVDMFHLLLYQVGVVAALPGINDGNPIFSQEGSITAAII